MAWCADLTTLSAAERRFDLVLVTRYLQRDLFRVAARGGPAGRRRDLRDVHARSVAARTGPTSPDHLLEPGELRSSFERFRVLFYEEVNEPEALARLVARREA